MEVNHIIGLAIAISFTGYLLYLREKNRRRAQKETLGRVIGFKEGLGKTWDNIRYHVKSFVKNIFKVK